MHVVRKHAGAQEPSGPVLIEHNRPATSFPLSDSVAFFHRQTGSYCAKPVEIRFGSGRLGQVLAEGIRSGSN